MILTSMFKFRIIIFISLIGSLSSCVDQEKFKEIGIHEQPRWEFAPNMYYSEAYEPLKQVTDESEGLFVKSNEGKVGDHYNSNPLNPHKMNMRDPAKNTIKRNSNGYLPYHISKDSLEFASKTLVNPLKPNDTYLAEGEVLFNKFCAHCHGAEGKGDGPVNSALKGVANLAEGQLKNISEGHIFHVITHGKGRMWPHGSQVDQEERWKIAMYVKSKIQPSAQ